MKMIFSLLATAFFIAGCAHQNQVASSHYLDDLYHKQGAEMLRQSEPGRHPAVAATEWNSLSANMADLNSVKPGKFKVFVFPKMNPMKEKNSLPDARVYLGKPRVNEVSLLVRTDCRYMLNQKGFAKYSPAKYFPASLATKKTSCSIVEVTSRSMMKMNKSLLRDGDEIAKRVYLDDEYNVYGIETDYYAKNAKKTNQKTVGMSFAAGTPSTSGLGVIPVDLPAPSLLSEMKVVDATQVFADGRTAKISDLSFQPDKSVVDHMAQQQIKREEKDFSAPHCRYRKLSYLDYFSNPVSMYWCEGLPWPQVVETNQFVAVTQNLKLKDAK